MTRILSKAKIHHTNSKTNLLKEYIGKFDLLVGTEVEFADEFVTIERIHTLKGRKEFEDMVDDIKVSIESEEGRCITYKITEVRVS